MFLEGHLHGWQNFGLNPDHANSRIRCLESQSHPGNQSSAPDRHNELVRRARKRWLAVAAALVAVALPAAALATGLARRGHHRHHQRHQPAGGLYGRATKGPLTPVCRVGVPCTGPARNVRLLFVRNGHVLRVRTRPDGRYRVALPKGRYRLRSKVGMGVVRPQRVSVPRRFIRVDLFLDTGIR